jgi:hypothetical protein
MTKVERFLKDVNDIRSARIEEEMEAIANCTLVFLPKQPVDPSEFYNSNLTHRQNTGKLWLSISLEIRPKYFHIQKNKSTKSPKPSKARSLN